MNDDQVALVAKALAHPARLQILRLLATQAECMGSQVFGSLPLAQSTISQHMSLLKAAGLVSSHSVGQGHVYCLNQNLIGSFSEAVESIAAGAPACCPSEER